MRSKVLVMVAAIALAIVLGAVDYITGREWAISAFFPTCLVAFAFLERPVAASELVNVVKRAIGAGSDARPDNS